MALPVLIAAVDMGPHTARVLYHAAGFARLLDLRLKILHVAGDASVAAHERLLNDCLQLAPYQLDLDAADVVIRTGRVSDAIAREAHRDGATLVVMGARGHGAVASFLLGSTSDAVLRGATVPVLLVPPTDLDIVNIGDRVALTCGPVIAAVDLTEHCDEQLRIGQPPRQHLVSTADADDGGEEPAHRSPGGSRCSGSARMGSSRGGRPR